MVPILRLVKKLLTPKPAKVRHDDIRGQGSNRTPPQAHLSSLETSPQQTLPAYGLSTPIPRHCQTFSCHPRPVSKALRSSQNPTIAH